MHVRSLGRIAVIAFLVAVALANGLPDIVLPWQPLPTYGFSASPHGEITDVDDTAQRAGLRTGDRIELSRLTPESRMAVETTSVARAPRIALPLTDGRSVAVLRHANARTVLDNVTDVIVVLALGAYIILAGLLVLYRATPVTWAFFAFSFIFCCGGSYYESALPFGMVVLINGVISAAFIVSGAAFFSFAMRFPDSEPRGSAALAEKALLAIGFAGALCFFTAALTRTFMAAVLPNWAATVWLFALYASYAAGIAVLIARFVTTAQSEKNRMRWVVVAFTVAFVPALIELFVENVLNIFPEVSIINIVQTFELLAPVALAYAILKHRLFDIRFVLSRALLYAVLTSIVVALLALADWAAHAWLAQSRFALAAELVLAVVIGLVITGIHRRVEHFLNSVIFRAQDLALHALRRFARETDLIADPNHLIRQTHQALRARLESQYVAIYTLERSSYAIVTGLEGDVPALFTSHDFAVLRLRRWHEPFECDEPDHPLRGALLLPMTARAELIGFIACGPKDDHTHYLRGEIDTLSLLAHRVGSAYALLTLAQASSGLGTTSAAPF